ncbi:MAG: universal stress protein [Chloroherpetonaceae bacterium]
MNRFEHILLAIDIKNTESETRQAHQEHFEDAIELAQKQDATLSLIHILPDSTLHPKLKEATAKHAAEILELLRVQLNERGVKKVSIHVQYGDVAPAIVDAAKKLDASMIMLYEKHADTKHLLSSVVGKIIRLSPIPVWTTLKGARKEIRKILCPVDCSPASKEALNMALSTARIYGASVHVLFVFEPITHVPMFVKVNLEEVNREGKAQAERQLEGFLQVFDSETFTSELCEGKASSKILERLSQFDLLVMGTTGRTGMSRWVMGSVTETVIRNAPCSFVTTHAQTILPERLEEALSQIESHFKAGAALLNAQKPKESVKEFLECLRIDMFYVPAMLKLSEAYQKLGETHEAKQYQRQAEAMLERLWGKMLADEIVRASTK